MVIAGNRAPQVEISRIGVSVSACSVNVHNSICARFTPSFMDFRVWSQVIALGGGAYRFTVFRAHISDKNSGNNTKVIFNHVDRIYGPDEDQMNWIWLKKQAYHLNHTSGFFFMPC